MKIVLLTQNTHRNSHIATKNHSKMQMIQNTHANRRGAMRLQIILSLEALHVCVQSVWGFEAWHGKMCVRLPPKIVHTYRKAHYPSPTPYQKRCARFATSQPISGVHLYTFLMLFLREREGWLVKDMRSNGRI